VIHQDVACTGDIEAFTVFMDRDADAMARIPANRFAKAVSLVPKRKDGILRPNKLVERCPGQIADDERDRIRLQPGGFHKVVLKVKNRPSRRSNAGVVKRKHRGFMPKSPFETESQRSPYKRPGIPRILKLIQQ